MFKGTTSLFDRQRTEVIDTNFKYWLDWSFLNIGGFVNVTINTSGGYGGDYSRLIPVKDYFYSDGQVWKTFHSNLVWESGLSYNTQPIAISGVYIDGVFTSVSGSVDYANGRVIFDTPIATSSVIQMEYSYKIINVYSDSECDWMDELQRDTYRVDRQNYTTNSGDYQRNRIQLPAVVYHISKRTNKPYQLGLGQWGQFEISCDILGNQQTWVNKVADILSDQGGKTNFLFNVDLVATSGKFALTQSGTLNTDPLTYDNLINSDYRWNKQYILDTRQGDHQKLKNNLYYIPVKLKTEIVLTNI